METSVPNSWGKEAGVKGDIREIRQPGVREFRVVIVISHALVP